MHQTGVNITPPNVAILTGRANGTTLMDGEVSVNCGTRLSMCESRDRPGQRPSDDHSNNNSICRINLDHNTTIDESSVSVEEHHLRCELAQARARVEQLEVSQSELQQKLNSQSRRLLSIDGNRFDCFQLDDTNRRNSLIRKYEQLYSQVRVDVLDALDQMDELKEFVELKTKLLFSVMVLAYRSTEQTLREISASVRSVLRVDCCTSHDPSTDHRSNLNDQDELVSARHELETAVGHYLRVTCAYFDTHHNVEKVCAQIWSTLFDYPCLQKCPALVDFVQQCSQLSWTLHVQRTRFTLDIDTKEFREQWHSRALHSDPTTTTIKCYLWPSLFEEGICVHKGTVLT